MSKYEKFIVAALAIIAVNILLLVQTPSILQSQHTFVNLKGNGNDINCTSCHPQIAEELAKSQIHSNFKCEECHRIKVTAEGVDLTYAEANASSWTSGKEAHAAYVPRCLDCHGGNGVYVDYQGVTKIAPIAKGLNSTQIPDYVAHKNFVEWANQSGLAVGENEACLACHTNFSVKIEFRYFWNISYTKNSDWTLTNFNVNGTRVYAISFIKSGDQGKHEWKAVSLSNQDSYNETFCIKCHKNVYDALVNGTPDTPYNDYTHAPIEIGGRWETNNYWGHTRYHYIPDSNRATWVNSTYCLKCHNVAKYASINPSDATTYDLSNVTADTNSTSVHVAERLKCITCHGTGKAKDPFSVMAVSGYSASYPALNISADHRKVMSEIGTYANSFNGDMCMGCHEAADHTGNMVGNCNWCHSIGGGSSCGPCHGSNINGGNGYTLNVNIESEPSGALTR